MCFLFQLKLFNPYYIIVRLCSNINNLTSNRYALSINLMKFNNSECSFSATIDHPNVFLQKFILRILIK